jgi:hypothetical protein
MSASDETKSAPLGLRITPTLKKALEQAAADDRRPVSSYVEKVLHEHLKKKGYLKG